MNIDKIKTKPILEKGSGGGISDDFIEVGFWKIKNDLIRVKTYNNLKINPND